MALLTVARPPIGSASATVRTAIAPLARELNENIYRPQSTSKTHRFEANGCRALSGGVTLGYFDWQKKDYAKS